MPKGTKRTAETETTEEPLEKKSNSQQLETAQELSAKCPLISQLNTTFLVNHPQELLQFWQFVNSLNPKNPRNAFSKVQSLKLVGPFDFLVELEGDGKAEEKNWLVHSRNAVDLPEMQTLMSYEGGRFCYWRDTPSSSSPYLIHVCSDPPNFPQMELIGSVDPFHALFFLHKKNPSLKKLFTSEKFMPTEKLKEMETYEKLLTEIKKRRSKESIGQPFHGLGIKVEMNGDVGYRPVTYDLKKFKQQLITMGTTKDEALKPLTRQSIFELFSYVQFANDELDFGMGLEFGHDLFHSNYPVFDGMAKSVLQTAYELLGRQAFSKIICAQLEVGRR